MIPQVFETMACLSERDGKLLFKHFNINPDFANIYGVDKKDIRILVMKVCDDQSEIEDADVPDYWGWFDNESNRWSLIYPKKFLLNMCFPNVDISIQRGQGKRYRLEIIEVKELKS